MIGVSELLKSFGIDEITELSLKILCKSINSIPLLMNGILILSFMVDLRIDIRTKGTLSINSIHPLVPLHGMENHYFISM